MFSGRKEYASLAGRVAAKYKRAVLAELFPLARTVYRMCLDHGRDARVHSRVFQECAKAWRPSGWCLTAKPVHSRVFQECAKAADADVCWKCGSLESVFWSKHEKYRKMCTGCFDALVYAAA